MHSCEHPAAQRLFMQGRERPRQMKYCHHKALQLNIINLQPIKRRHVSRSFSESWRPLTSCLRVCEVEIGGEGPRSIVDFRHLREKRGTNFVKSVLSAVLSQNLLQRACLQRRGTHPLAIYRVKATDIIAKYQQPFRKGRKALVMALQANRNAMMCDGAQPFGFLNDLADQR